MKIRFTKYHGTGNDFIIINNISNSFPKDNSEVISKLCDRKFGIGADGLILIEKHLKFHFEMIYYNSDGNLGSMCGNGARCSIHFSMLNKLIKNKTNFLAFDGSHTGSVIDNLVNVSMSDVLSFQKLDDFILVDTGSNDEYIDLLLINSLSKVLKERKMNAIFRMNNGYDHSYYFIATFIEEHMNFHAKALFES